MFGVRASTDKSMTHPAIWDFKGGEKIESDQIVETDLPHSEDSLVETIQLQPVSSGSE